MEQYEQNPGTYTQQPQQYDQPQYILPPHSNKMAISIICAIFCCQIGGVVGIIYSSKSNSLYNSALMTNDESLKQNLFRQSEASNSTAQTWITVSLVWGIVQFIVTVLYFVFVGLSEL